MNKELQGEFINTLLRLKNANSRILTNGGLSWGALMILDKLHQSGNVNGICEKLHVTKPAVSYMLNSFEKGGYITRSIDTNDRRRIDVDLTEKGKELVNSHKKTYEVFLNGVFLKFGEENSKNLIQLLNRFADIIDEMKEEG
ncbi:MAG: MarR family transcriptional regulator [Treponema sp.]|nr:MarR family transcriptional regulator [Treponema sp.]